MRLAMMQLRAATLSVTKPLYLQKAADQSVADLGLARQLRQMCPILGEKGGAMSDPDRQREVKSQAAFLKLLKRSTYFGKLQRMLTDYSD